MTEAGIIGQIGLNNEGLGVTLNILRILDQELAGVPIHIVLRAVLESSTLEEAKEAINRSGHGKASNIIIAQSGRAIDVEFAGGRTYFYEIKDDAYAHTNHYLHTPNAVPVAGISYADSFARYSSAVNCLSNMEEFSLQTLGSTLSDQTNAEHPILARYEPHSIQEMGNCGTLATLMMDLESKTMMVRKGNPSSPSFSIENFVEYHIPLR